MSNLLSSRFTDLLVPLDSDSDSSGNCTVHSESGFSSGQNFKFGVAFSFPEERKGLDQGHFLFSTIVYQPTRTTTTPQSNYGIKSDTSPGWHTI
jgi:hypothetical protein